jgi:hypothetical protein
VLDVKQQVKKELREGILRQIEGKFKTKLKKDIQQFSPSGQPLSPSVTSDVSAKFQQTFSNYLATAFDIVFGNDIISAISANEKKEQISQNSNNDQLNLSVTNEQLQEMDNSVTKVARRRKEYPKKCSKFLEKTLELQAKTAEKIRVNVNNVEPLEENGVTEEEFNDTEIQEKLGELQSSVRKQIQKSVRIEGSLRMLRETVATE